MPPSLQQIQTTPSRFAEQAEAHALDWVVRHHLISTPTGLARLSATRPGALAAHCFPPASAEQSRLLAAWMSWLFVIDDQNDEGLKGRMPNSFADELANIEDSAFYDSHLSGGALGDSLRVLWHEMCIPMTMAWRRRFRRHMADFFSAYVSQAAHRALDQVPVLATFPQFRRDAGAIWPSFDLIEYVQGSSLPPSLYMSRCYQELLTSAADVVCWTNDLLTFEKELAYGDVHNYVFVIQHARCCQLQRAVDEVMEKTERRLQAFLNAETALPETLHQLNLSKDLQTDALGTVQMLRAWIYGHVAWGETTGRYQTGPGEGAVTEPAVAAASMSNNQF